MSADTLRALAPVFLAEHKPRLRWHIPDAAVRARKERLYLASWRSDVHHLYAVTRPDGAALADLPLPAWTQEDVEQLRDQMIAAPPQGLGLAGGTATRTIGAFSVLFAWWKKRERFAGANPCLGVRRPPSGVREEYLLREQIPPLYERCRRYGPPMLLPMLATALNTGMRKGELFGLRRARVHLFDRALAQRKGVWGRIDVVASYDGPPKGGKPRAIGINSDLAPVLGAWLEACPPTPEGLIFPVPARPQNSPGGPWGDWPGPFRMGSQQHMVGLRELLPERPAGEAWEAPWHAMRRTFGSSYMQRHGRAGIFALSKILGHANVLTTERHYVRFAPDFLAEGMEGLGLGLEAAPQDEDEPADESERLRALRRELRQARRALGAAEAEQDRLRWKLAAAEEHAAGGRTCAEGWTAWDAWGARFVAALEVLGEPGAHVLDAFGSLQALHGAAPSVRALSRYLGYSEMYLGRWLRRQGLPAPPRGSGPRQRVPEETMVELRRGGAPGR